MAMPMGSLPLTNERGALTLPVTDGIEAMGHLKREDVAYRILPNLRAPAGRLIKKTTKTADHFPLRPRGFRGLWKEPLDKAPCLLVLLARRGTFT